MLDSPLNDSSGVSPAAEPRRRTRYGRVARALLLALPFVSGCQYAKNRALDLYDTFPVSVAAGYGAAAEVRFTPYLGLGGGWANEWRAGMDENRFGPLWWEKERGIPILGYYRYQDYREQCSRWSGGDPYWWFETHRLRATSWIILPGAPRDGGFWWPFLPPYYLRVPFTWPRWAKSALFNAEAGVFLGVAGVRVAISPMQFVDFLGGFFMWDPVEDDEGPEGRTWPDFGVPETYADAPAPATNDSETNSDDGGKP